MKQTLEDCAQLLSVRVCHVLWRSVDTLAGRRSVTTTLRRFLVQLLSVRLVAAEHGSSAVGVIVSAGIDECVCVCCGLFVAQ